MKSRQGVSKAPTNKTLLLKEVGTLLFYIRNLAHNAWLDPKNAEPLFRRIEAYAEQARALVEVSRGEK